ncbi:hypothetical protein N665_3173s0006 [Sinapis alba]|nr:hypothetical protein N665_3173s0006 [Sinapis alba]
MPQDGNHKVMGMWMLLLRNVRIAKEKEAWFAVNGSPIRYGIREHALISGLNCRNYPLNYKNSGGTKFVEKYFGRGIIRYQDVKAKVRERIEPTRDRLRLLVLYFLSSVILGQTKSGNEAPPVDPFLLRAVDDLKLCRTFPWGRLSFDYMMKEISHTMAHFGGEVKEGVIWPIPGFCIPMELLAFEAITELGSKFRVAVEDASPTCPRMCQSKFKRSEMKGFPLSKINKELGNTKDIENILSVSEEEQTLLDHITEPEDIRDKDDVIVESWMKRLGRGYVVRFEDMLEEDVTAREAPPIQNGGNETGGTTNEAGENSMKVNELVEMLNSFKADVGQWMKKIEDKVGEFDLRLAASEDYVQEVGSMAMNAGVGEEDNSKRPKKRSKKN